MEADDLNHEWLTLSPAWIKEARQGRNPTRTGLLDEPMLAACGDVRGQRILDCGCGEGRFCRILLERGASSVLGLDVCPPMIAAAIDLKSPHDDYRIADVQNLSFLATASFDCAISYLNQCDLPDVQANNREVFRILKPRGLFVIANLHPMRSAVGGWHKDAAGQKLHVILDRYFDEGPRRWKMMGADFTNFHRSLATSIDGFRQAGFSLDRIVEPTITPEQLQLYPELEDERRVPNFIIYILQKP